MASTSLYPSPRANSAFPPFPDDIPTAPLVTISLRKLVESTSAEEHECLFSAAKSLGFFYLDLRGTLEGENLLQQADDMFDLMNEFFSLPVEEKAKYDFAAKKSYFGYKGIGKEVVDGKGTKDKNEIYNVTKYRPLYEWPTH
jgi:isopenicillin N synthase-like dioxygenase